LIAPPIFVDGWKSGTRAGTAKLVGDLSAEAIQMELPVRIERQFGNDMGVQRASSDQAGVPYP